MAYVLTKADLVWNRALSDHPGTGVGDWHLQAMAKPHGRIMNGGVSAVMDICTAEEVQHAADAFAYLGLADLAGLPRRLIDADWWSEDDIEDRLNRTFYGLDYALVGVRAQVHRSPGRLRPRPAGRSRTTTRLLVTGSISVSPTACIRRSSVLCRKVVCWPCMRL